MSQLFGRGTKENQDILCTVHDHNGFRLVMNVGRYRCSDLPLSLSFSSIHINVSSI
jgi:hypothetical protein